MTGRAIALYVTVGIVVVMLGALLGWYIVLQKQHRALNTTDAARGLGVQTPSFAGQSSGSTQYNFSSSQPLTSSSSRSYTSSSSTTSPLLTLRNINATPVAGFGFVTTATSTYIVYVEKGSGHILRAKVASNSVERISNTLTPHVYAAQVAEDGSVIEQYQTTDGALSTIAIPANNVVSSSSISVAQNNTTIVLNPHTRTLLYLAPAAQGGVNGFVKQWPYTTLKKKPSVATALFYSFLTEWNVYYMPDSRIFVSQRAADNVPGFAYQVNSSGVFVPIFENIPGLAILPHPTTGAVAYSSSANGSVSLFVQTDKKSNPQQLSLATITEKCVWLNSKSFILYCAVPSNIPTSSYLNDWHRGVVHTDDNWWIIDGAAGTAKQLYSPHTSDAVALDVVDPRIDSSGNYIAFKNNVDQSLWLFKIPQ